MENNDLDLITNELYIDLLSEKIFVVALFAFCYGFLKRLLDGLNTENGVDINNPTGK